MLLDYFIFVSNAKKSKNKSFITSYTEYTNFVEVITEMRVNI
jgi:hypothetical protein